MRATASLTTYDEAGKKLSDRELVDLFGKPEEMECGESLTGGGTGNIGPSSSVVLMSIDGCNPGIDTGFSLTVGSLCPRRPKRGKSSGASDAKSTG